ncbi:hypothetical protein PM082_017534 [Marasmius tenuissimus]|nr:hypothetical protein PM082_017534 [Marasmius tenuissimus]
MQWNAIPSHCLHTIRQHTEDIGARPLSCGVLPPGAAASGDGYAHTVGHFSEAEGDGTYIRISLFDPKLRETIVVGTAGLSQGRWLYAASDSHIVIRRGI